MGLENKRLYTWLPWAASLLITVFFVMLLIHEWAFQEKEWQAQLSLQQGAAQAALEMSQQDLLRQAEVFAQLIVDDQDVALLVREALLVHMREGGNGGAEQSAVLRGQLQKVFAPYWVHAQLLGARGLTLHFGESIFLSSHHPERFGDDVTSFRPLLMSVLSSGNPASGMEVGRYGPNYRALLPFKLNEGQRVRLSQY